MTQAIMRRHRWKLTGYLLVIALGVLTALPNVLLPAQLSALPPWVSQYQLTLGLDLRGGSHLVLEVDAEVLIKERLQALVDDVRRALRAEKITRAAIAIADNAVSVVLPDASHEAEALRALEGLVGRVGLVSRGANQPTLELAAPDGRHIKISLTSAGVRDLLGAAVEQSLEIVRKRIDEVGVSEPTIQRVGADRILVQLPGVQDPQRIKTLLGSTAKLTFHLVTDPWMRSSGSAGLATLAGREESTRYKVEERPILGGDRLVDARPGFDQRTGQPIVSFRFDNAGGRIFGNFTQSHVGQALAIVLDNRVLSAPIIQEPILGGSGQISGHFTVEEATDLAALLRAGALPAPLTVIEERTVGPDLGSDAIRMGVWTGLAGFALVFGFMLVLYGLWGLIANFALLLNVVLVFGALSWLGATLTLPGIAGIVLGIGLAVDANVLINERIREETRKGLSALAALDTGFKRAYATVVDSNLTTLIASTLLFMFGAGPVRGFAVTMGLGIIISMFTAVSVVRVIMERIVRRRKLKVLRIEPPIRLVPDGTRIGFMRARFLGIGLSIFLSLVSVALFVTPGLNFGIDFRGGILIEVQAPRPPDLAALRAKLDSLATGEVSLQEFGGPSSILVRTELQSGGEKAQSEAMQRLKDAVAQVVPGAQIMRAEVVGPKLSGELAQTGVVAVAVGCLAMLAYIWVRFEWPFAVGAIATLGLDVAKTIGFFALTGLDFNLTAIAALLTLIGFSVNDKVVVYDRMRENMRLYKKMALRDLIDRSINETLARSIFTSATAFLAMLPMALWGGSAVESFAIPMLFGIVVATSSSIFIAAPILLFLGDWRARRRKRLAPETSPAIDVAR